MHVEIACLNRTLMMGPYTSMVSFSGVLNDDHGDGHGEEGIYSYAAFGNAGLTGGSYMEISDGPLSDYNSEDLQWIYDSLGNIGGNGLRRWGGRRRRGSSPWQW